MSWWEVASNWAVGIGIVLFIIAASIAMGPYGDDDE